MRRPEKIERGQRFGIQMSRRLETGPRLIGTKRNPHLRAIDAVDPPAIQALAHQVHLRANDYRSLSIRRCVYERCSPKRVWAGVQRLVRTAGLVRWRPFRIIRVLKGARWSNRLVRAPRFVIGSRSVRNRWVGRTGWDRRGLRGNSQGALSFSVNLAGNVQAVTDLITTEGGGRFHVLFAGDFSVIKPLVLQLLL